MMGLQNPVSSDQPMASHRPQNDARDQIKKGLACARPKMVGLLVQVETNPKEKD